MPVICVDVKGSDQSPEVVLGGSSYGSEKDKELGGSSLELMSLLPFAAL